MKRICLWSACCISLFSCIGYQELPVEYDYSYKGSFTKYKSFDIMTWSSPEGRTHLDTLIEKNIISRMKFLGYKRTDHKPHLLVTYRMYADSLMFHAYNQPDIEQWAKAQPVKVNYDAKMLEMKTGTLLIQFYDKRQNRAIWQGYTTAVYTNLDFYDHRNIRNAVGSILDKYRFMAEGFLETNGNQADGIN